MAIANKTSAPATGKVVSPTRFAETARDLVKEGGPYTLVRVSSSGEDIEVSSREIGAIPGVYKIISNATNTVWRECSTLDEQKPSPVSDDAKRTEAWGLLTGKYEFGIQFYMQRDEIDQKKIEDLKLDIDKGKAEVNTLKDDIRELIIKLKAAEETQTTEFTEFFELVRDFAPMLLEQNGTRLMFGKLREVMANASPELKSELVKLVNANPGLPTAH